MNQKLEILSPAGSMESIAPAVRMGADAVYLGGPSFSARTSAHNFNHQELQEAVEYCHLHNRKVYLALNTMIHDDEMKQALELAQFAAQIHIDALIMQDLGLISLVRKYAPEMRIHGSTQMSVHTRKGVEKLAEMGLKRIVLSRELSREEIKEIAKDCPVELEVFVHGALCMSVSGQCYFSAMLGSRSGNRGACAQPCRLPFSVKNGTGHDLSLKDLSIIPYLRELQEIGVASAKIEGRMKRPEYVAAAVAACRESLDNGFVSTATEEKLKAVFSRSGFTDGYYQNQRGVNMFGIRSKEDVLSADKNILTQIRLDYKNEIQDIPVDFELNIHSGKPVVLKAADKDGHTAEITGMIPEVAQKVSLTEERCRESLLKTGGTAFSAEHIKIELDEGLSLPVSSFNTMRRKILEEIRQKRIKKSSVDFQTPELSPVSCRKNISLKNFRCRFTDCCISDDFLESELIYVPLNSSDQEFISLMDRGFAVAAEIPRGMFGIEKKIYQNLERVKRLGVYEVLASNMAAIQMAQELKMDIHGGFGLNLGNTEALIWAEQQGLIDTEISFELTLAQISELGGHIPLGIITEGRLPLMLTRNCPAMNDHKGCHHCQTASVLKDRRNTEFPLKCQGACTEVLNSVPVSMSDKKSQITGCEFEVLRFSTETPDERIKILKNYLSGRTPQTFTRGLYYRGVE